MAIPTTSVELQRLLPTRCWPKYICKLPSSKRTATAGVLGNQRYNAIDGTPNSYYQLAKDQCDLTIGESGYQLVSNLEDWKKIFDASNGNNSEMLFEVQGSSIVEQGTAVSNLFSQEELA